MAKLPVCSPFRDLDGEMGWFAGEQRGSVSGLESRQPLFCMFLNYVVWLCYFGGSYAGAVASSTCFDGSQSFHVSYILKSQIPMTYGTCDTSINQ